MHWLFSSSSRWGGGEMRPIKLWHNISTVGHWTRHHEVQLDRIAITFEWPQQLSQSPHPPLTAAVECFRSRRRRDSLCSFWTPDRWSEFRKTLGACWSNCPTGNETRVGTIHGHSSWPHHIQPSLTPQPRMSLFISLAVTHRGPFVCTAPSACLWSGSIEMLVPFLFY